MRETHFLTDENKNHDSTAQQIDMQPHHGPKLANITVHMLSL